METTPVMMPVFATLAEQGIPFCRFCATVFGQEMRLYLTNRAEYFRRMDGVVQSAQKHGVGLVPSLFWYYSTAPDIVGEPVGEWANPRSKTQAFMREYVREMVTHYRDNAAIWLWEFGNEYSLAASLPNAKEHRPPVAPNWARPQPQRARQLTFAYAPNLRRICQGSSRQYDPASVIVTGDAFRRSSAWHRSTRANGQRIRRSNSRRCSAWSTRRPSAPISVHLYAVDEGRLAQAVQAAQKLNKPLFVGEFGAPGESAGSGKVCRRQLKSDSRRGCSIVGPMGF